MKKVSRWYLGPTFLMLLWGMDVAYVWMASNPSSATVARPAIMGVFLALGIFSSIVLAQEEKRLIALHGNNIPHHGVR